MRFALPAVLALVAACSADPVLLPDASTPDAGPCQGLCGAGTTCVSERCVTIEDGGADAGTSLDAPAGDVATDLGAPADAGMPDSGASDVGDDTNPADVPVTVDATPDVATALDAATDVPAIIDATLDVPATPDVPTASTLRPIAPLTGAHAPSRRPTLRWALPAGVGGVRVTLCRNRALSTGCTSFDATGTTGAPTADLAPGVWYWSLRALASGAPTGTATAVWRLRVASATTAGARPWGGDPDFNGDGYADVFVARPQVSIAVYAGGPTGLAATPLTIPSPLDSTGFAQAVNFAGDFDGDGYGDLVVGSPGSDAVYLYRGSSAGLIAAPTTIVGPRGSGLGTSVDGAGDIDGDGYDDVVALNPAGMAVWVIPGGAAGAGMPVRVAGMSLANISALATLQGAGDVDGDGFADVVVRLRTGFSAYSTRLLRGAATGLDAARVTAALYAGGVDLNNDGLADLVDQTRVMLGAPTFSGAGSTPLGSDGFTNGGDGEVPRGGDFNGDGYDDLLAVGFVAPGGPTGPGTPIGLAVGFGTAAVEGMVGAGDVDGDGYDDALSRGTSVLYLIRGTATGLVLGRMIYSDLPQSTAPTDATRAPVALGDIDHDGHGDLALGRTFFRGSAAGFVPTPTWTVGLPGETVVVMSRVGDVNRDGYDDFLSYGRSPIAGRPFYFRMGYFLTLGSAVGPTAARYEFGVAEVGFPYPPSAPPLPAAASGYTGDFNGDGFADGFLTYASGIEQAFFTGRATVPATVPTIPATGLSSNAFIFAGDLNRDGYADLIGTSTLGTVNSRVVMGSATGPVVPAGGLSSPSLAALGDVNGDGYADVGLTRLGGAEIHLGSAAGVAVAASSIFTSSNYLRGVGDLNHDGYADCNGYGTLYFGSATGPTGVGAIQALGDVTLVQAEGALGFGDVDGDGASDLVLRTPRGVMIQRFDAPGPRAATLTVGTGDVVYR